MNAAWSPSAELADLIEGLCHNTITAEETARLEQIVLADPHARQYYVRYLYLHASLPQVLLPQFASTHHSPFSIQHSPAPFPPVIIQTLPSSLSSLPSFIGGPLFSYLVAIIILGIGLMIGAVVHVSRAPQVAVPSAPDPSPILISRPVEFVGRITAMVDCQWAEPSTEPVDGAYVPLGRKYAMSTGLMEITYDSGACVILQGPVTYEVESTAGGYLSVGKLTAKLEKRSVGSGQRSGPANQKSKITNQKSFAVRTPTAVVTDLGTEFGVEVAKDGNTQSHVFRGSVKVQLLGACSENRGTAVVLHENESIQTQPDADAAKPSVRLVRVNSDPRIFTRRISLSVKTLDLRDIVAGGDGRVQPRARGLDPINGFEETVLTLEPGAGHRPRRIGSADKLIDRVFLPDGNQGRVSLDSAEHTFDGFPKTNGRAEGEIGATSVGSRSNGKRTPDDCGLLGFRSSAGITFDLDAIRRRYARTRPTRFRASVFCGSSTGANILVQDDFQTDKAGTMPRDIDSLLMPVIGAGDLGGRWRYGLDSTTLIQVWNNVDPSKPNNNAGANHYVKVQRDAMTHDGDLDATGWPREATVAQHVTLRFSIWKDAASPAVAAVDTFTDEGFVGRSFSAYFHPDGSVWCYDGFDAVNTGLSYRMGAWQDVVITADMARQRFSLTVDGATASDLRWRTGVNSVNHVVFSNGVTPAGRFFVDNVKLTTSVGLAELQRRGFGTAGQGDFWVFVDGQMKLSRKNFAPKDGAVPVDVEIGPEDHYLTLVAAGDGVKSRPNWIVWTNPVLDMISTEDDPPATNETKAVKQPDNK